MMDIYKDGPRRYRDDAEFKQVVDALYNYARTSGATPGELRQIAAFAALKLEMEIARPVYALGFGPWWVCPNRTVSTTTHHSIAQSPGQCVCGESLVGLAV